MKNKFILKNILSAVGNLLFADILCLFINLTLAVFSMSIFKVISAACTTVIFIGILINFAWKVCQKEEKFYKQTGEIIPAFTAFITALIMSAPYIIMWCVLVLHKSDSFYRVYKLINGQFLQIYNLMENGSGISALGNAKLIAMLALCLVPFLTYISAYFYNKRRYDEFDKV